MTRGAAGGGGSGAGGWGRVGTELDRPGQGCNYNYMSTEQENPKGESRGGEAEDSAGGAKEREITGWFAGRLPGDWFAGPADVTADREEITVIGTLPDPDVSEDAEPIAAAEGRVRRFREETRTKRIEIAREAEHRFRRKVSWGVRCGTISEMFTTLSVPVMTRLRQQERRVLDTLVDAGVARSRSDALAWCVRLTGEHVDNWLTDLRAALRKVEEVREQGPQNAV
jgi:hypothetical protein